MDWSKLNQISCLPVSGLPGPIKALFPLPQFCIYPSASRTAFQMSNDDSVSIMSCYITALALRAPQHSSPSFHLWLTPYMDFSADSQTSQSISQPDSHAQPTSLHGEAAVTGAKETGWFINPAFFMIYIKVYDPRSWLKVMEGVEAARCTQNATWPSYFTLNDEVIDF